MLATSSPSKRKQPTFTFHPSPTSTRTLKLTASLPLKVVGSLLQMIRLPFWGKKKTPIFRCELLAVSFFFGGGGVTYNVTPPQKKGHHRGGRAVASGPKSQRYSILLIRLGKSPPQKASSLPHPTGGWEAKYPAHGGMESEKYTSPTKLPKNKKLKFLGNHFMPKSSRVRLLGFG